MENDKYKGMLSKCYKGEKIDELINLDKQIKELQEKRRNLSREIERDTIGINISEFPICGFLYYDTWETKLVKNSNNYWSPAHRKRTGKRIQDARLAFLASYSDFEYFSDREDEKRIKYYPDFRSVGSDNRPGNEFSTEGMDNMEFEPLDGMTLDEAKKILKKVKKDLKKEDE